jgi:chaperonin GroES
MKVQPLSDRILVKRIEAEEKTAGGIVVPDTAKEKPKEGKVISIGTGKVDDKGVKIPFNVKVGDRVLFESYAGTEVKIEGEEHLIMREDDVLGIIEK